jgi:RND superfamily putative drug exporter
VTAVSSAPTAPAPEEAPRSRFARLGRFVARRRRLVLVIYVAGLLVAGTLGSQLLGSLKSEGFDDQGSESARAARALTGEFGVQDPLAVLAVRSPAGVDDPAGTAAATALVREISSRPGVRQVVSYWTSGKPEALRGRDGQTGEVLVYGTPGSDQEATGRAIDQAYGGSHDELGVQVGGFAVVGHAINSHVTKDLARAEAVAIPLTLLLLLVVFGTAVSAALPFSVAAGAILGSFLVVWLVTLATDVSVFALNLITGLGLGLGIDYALLVVNRFREELGRGLDVEAAVGRTVATAGKTVVVSGLTVCVVLASLLFFPQYFLVSLGYAGVAVTLLAVASTVTALPALLAVLGPRIDRLRVRRGLTPRDEGAWSRIAHVVMRRPWPVLLGVLALLLALASPALSAAFSQVDARVLPPSDPAAVASRVIGEQFPGREATPVDVILPGGAGNPEQVRAYAQQLSRVDGVKQVTAPDVVVADGRAVAPNPQPRSYSAGQDVRLSVVGTVEPRSAAGQRLVKDLRAVPAPVPDRLVGGAAASFTDSQDALVSSGRWALLWIAGATLVVLFLFTGSVVLPVKALVLNVLSLGATLGVLVWVFQEGHLRSLLGNFTVTGTIDTSTGLLVAVVAFALSMDYEVFLLSRIKEEHDAGSGTVESVALGLQRSGRIITAAALLLAVVFAAFLSASVTSIKLLGLGVAFAILLDATVVRGLLVPAFMRLAGRWNWWAPAPLAALHRRIGLRES